MVDVFERIALQFQSATPDTVGVITCADWCAVIARLHAQEEALREIVVCATYPQQHYDRNGPQWTSPQGNEYHDTSAYLDTCNLIADVANQALSGAPVPVVTPKVKPLEWAQSEIGHVAHGVGAMYEYAPDSGVIIARMHEGSSTLSTAVSTESEAREWAQSKETQRILSALAPNEEPGS